MSPEGFEHSRSIQCQSGGHPAHQWHAERAEIFHTRPVQEASDRDSSRHSKSPEDVVRETLKEVFRDFTVELHRGIHLCRPKLEAVRFVHSGQSQSERQLRTQLSSAQEYSDVHCQLLEEPNLEPTLSDVLAVPTKELFGVECDQPGPSDLESGGTPRAPLALNSLCGTHGK